MKTKKILVFFILLFTITSGKAQIKVNSSGKTVIGPTTTWADYNLNITGSGTAGCGGTIGFGDNSTSTLNVLIGEYGTTDSDQLLLHGDNGIYFSTTESLTTKMFLDEDGKFGIGTTPSEKLHINGSIRGNLTAGALKVQTDAGYMTIGPYNGSFAHFYTDLSCFYFHKTIKVNGGIASYYNNNLNLLTDYLTRLTILRSNGYVGINTTSPSYQLDVNGIIRCIDLIELSSDERLKKDIKAIDAQTINNLYYLQAKSYIMDNSLRETENEIISELNDTLANEEFDKIEIDTTPKIGFIAQQLMEYFPNLVSQDNEGFYAISYTSLIPVIVEAIKEQRLIIDSLACEISVLKNYNSGNLKSSILANTENLNEHLGEVPILYQNIPNPFNQDTEIKFYLPEQVDKATLIIYNMQGNQLISTNITQRGDGYEVIQGSDLKPGMYLYTLIVNGLEVDTKRMILTD